VRRAADGVAAGAGAAATRRLPPEMDRTAHFAPAYVGIGSNLDEPRRQVELATAELAALPRTRLIASSPLYQTRPVGPQDQPDFVNSTAALLTQLDAATLLAELRALEQRLGKQPPAVRFGPRRIDLDLLVFGSECIDTPSLQVPHPRLHERAFVLYPLADLAPALWIPGRGRVAALKAAVAGEVPTPL
jgi:2-amino-4-hydroxy-6-hydroxymethyldihydropteridine diphosphokinase